MMRGVDFHLAAGPYWRSQRYLLGIKREVRRLALSPALRSLVQSQLGDTPARWHCGDSKNANDQFRE